MCGLVAVIASEPRDVDLAGALSALRHRGPDGAGQVHWPGPGLAVRAGAGAGRAHLGHVRLAIIDRSPAGAQPMATADGRHWLVLNGEIYNHAELRRCLEAAGERFRGRSDTEVALAALARWGREEALARFEGMFALVHLDARDGSVLAARDPFGIKPLYHARCDRGLAFASEPTALLRLPGVDRTTDPGRLWDYLAHGVTDHGSGTLFRGISQVAAGTAMELAADGAMRSWRHWQPPAAGSGRLPPAAAARLLRDRLLASVRSHLRSDVPVGVALSGGIDSSAIACAMRRVEPGACIDAFTYAPDDPAISEADHAQAVAARIGARWHRVTIDPATVGDRLASLVAAHGEPFGSTRILAQHAVFAAARAAGVVVMLDGQGADELFAGYDHYQSWRLAGLLAAGHPGRALRLALAQRRWPGRAPWRIVLRGLADGCAAARDITTAPWWAEPGWFADHGIALGQRFGRHRGGRLLADELAESRTTTHLPGLLRYEDRNAMLNGVESRLPFLARPLAAAAIALPEAALIGPDGSSKRILRLALRGLVPDRILDRRDKLGFATPADDWLRRCPGLVERALAADLPGIDRSAVRRRLADPQMRHGFLAWRLVNYGLWYEHLVRA